MIEREVVRTNKNDEGDIIGLCFKDGDGELHIPSESAIKQILAGTHSYFVGGDQPQTIHVKRYLTTNPDTVKDNNLDNLPDCTPKPK